MAVEPIPEFNPTTAVIASLASVALRRGIDISPESLVRSYVLGRDELTTAKLIAVARDIGLDAKKLRPAWRDLPRLRTVLPALLRLKDGSALVLEDVVIQSTTGQVVVLRDPASGPDAEAVLDEIHLNDIWNGEIILLKRRYDLRDETQPFGLKWLLGQVLREKRLFRDIGIASLFITIFTLAPPFMVMTVIDKVLVNHSESTLIVIAAAIGFLIIFEMALSFLRRVFIEVTATRIDGRLNLYLMQKLLKLPMDYFERTPTGITLGKLGKIWQIRHFLTGQLFGTVLDMVTLFILVPVLLILSWQLSLFVFALTGCIFVIVYVYLKPLGRLFGRVTNAENAKGSFLVETIYGMRTVKSMALEGRRRHEWDIRVAESLRARHAWGMLANYPQTLVVPFERLIYSGSILLGAWMILRSPDSVSAGGIVAFSMIAGRAAQPLLQLAHLLESNGEVQEAVSEVASVMNVPPENARAGSGLRLPIHGEISFQSVQFRYTPSSPLALDRADFRIGRGTIFGIMGRSGSGKTTITRLLQGLNPNYDGVIKIDGMDLREIDLYHLRTSIGVVPQENFLFSGTVRENIGMAKPDATFREIVRAAQLAGAEEFIERMPRGYETYLEEGATNLSGGQRQRLAIARALVVDPPVLILDEATSALDAESEAIINANLMRIAVGRTIICVSHRLSMLVPADAILVMEKGRVYDLAPHDELLRRCDIYKQMWYTQNRFTEAPSPHAQLSVAHTPEV